HFDRGQHVKHVNLNSGITGIAGGVNCKTLLVDTSGDRQLCVDVIVRIVVTKDDQSHFKSENEVKRRIVHVSLPDDFYDDTFRTTASVTHLLLASRFTRNPCCSINDQ